MNKMILILVLVTGGAVMSGCGKAQQPYSSQFLYPENIETVYVEMFENDTFRRGLEYELTDAVAKRIEAETPYKIVSDRDVADSIISGKITTWGKDVLSYERQIGRPLEEQAEVVAVVNWKNLKTGQLIVNNSNVSDAMSYTVWLDQSFTNASTIAANRLAERIVEQMQIKW